MQINHCPKTTFREYMNNWHSKSLLIGAVATILLASSYASWAVHPVKGFENVQRCKSIGGDGAKGGSGGDAGAAGNGGKAGKGPNSGSGGNGGDANGGNGGKGGRGGDAKTLCVIIAPNIYQQDGW